MVPTAMGMPIVMAEPSEIFCARNGLLNAIRPMNPKYSTSSRIVRIHEIVNFCRDRSLKSGSSKMSSCFNLLMFPPPFI